MANPNNKNQSGVTLQNFLKNKSSKLQRAGKQREQAKKEIALKKKKLREKKTLLDSVIKKPTEEVSTLVLQNSTQNISNGGANLKEPMASTTGNSEMDTLVDFLEKKSTEQTQTLQQSTRAGSEQREKPTAKNRQTGKSVTDTENDQSVSKENKKWIQELIKNAIEEQKKWTKGVINDVKKELIKSGKSQSESIKVLIKGIVEEQMQAVKNQETMGSERRETGIAEEPKRKVIKKNLKKTVPPKRKEKIVKKVTPFSKKVR